MATMMNVDAVLPVFLVKEEDDECEWVHNDEEVLMKPNSKKKCEWLVYAVQLITVISQSLTWRSLFT